MQPWDDPERWGRLCRGEGCPFCEPGRPEGVVLEMPTARLSVPAEACLPGYACLIHRRHVVELHDLSDAEAAAFMRDLCRASAAVKHVCGAVKINLASFGNLVPHLHVHICPRRPGDRFEGRPLDVADLDPHVYAPGEHARYVAQLRAALGETS